MKSKINFTRNISLTFGIATALALAVCWSVAARAEDEKHDGHVEHHVTHMKHIKTQAEVGALKPGDLLAMVCSMCKYVELHRVTTDGSHVNLMTVGQEHTCTDCSGTVTVVGTAKGIGKNEELKHVCSKCGDDAMFVCATKAGSAGGHRHDDTEGK